MFDTARKVARLERALRNIANMPGEDDEWDGAAKFHEARELAARALDPGRGPAAHAARVEHERLVRKRGRELHRLSSAGQLLWLDDGFQSGAEVRVVDYGPHGVESIEVKIFHASGRFAKLSAGGRFVVNLGNVYESREACHRARGWPWPIPAPTVVMSTTLDVDREAKAAFCLQHLERLNGPTPFPLEQMANWLAGWYRVHGHEVGVRAFEVHEPTPGVGFDIHRAAP